MLMFWWFSDVFPDCFQTLHKYASHSFVTKATLIAVCQAQQRSNNWGRDQAGPHRYTIHTRCHRQFLANQHQIRNHPGSSDHREGSDYLLHKRWDTQQLLYIYDSYTNQNVGPITSKLGIKHPITTGKAIYVCTDMCMFKSMCAWVLRLEMIHQDLVYYRYNNHHCYYY